MNLTAKIGRPLVIPSFRNLYRINVQVDLGDHGSTEYYRRDFTDRTEALNHFALLLAWCRIENTGWHYNSYRERDPESLVEIAIRQTAKTLGMDEDSAFEWVESVVGDDNTIEDGWRAILQVADMTWFDEGGLPHAVEVTVQGGADGASYTSHRFRVGSKELRNLLWSKV